MKIQYIILLVTLIVSLNSCGSLAPSITPIPDSNSDAAKVYTQHCGSCHAVPHPMRLSYASWQNILFLMDKRIAERGMPKIIAENKKQILSYLESHAR